MLLTRHPRHLLVPNANSPELLGRLLEMVSRGVRSTRALAEALNIEARTVEYYTQAGEWLGLLDLDDEAELTPLGLEFVYAGEERTAVYARAVWANPMVAALLRESDDALPKVKAIAAAVAQIAPDMAKSTVRRRASAIRSLIAPAIGTLRTRPLGADRQMQLPLAASRAPPVLTNLSTVGDTEYNPDAYRYLLTALLDHGELELRHVRGLLDRAGAERTPIGGYIDMAIHRGDAFRDGDRLVTSPGAARRSELTESTASLILSDPRYRAYLETCRLGLTDRLAQAQAFELAPRFAVWDHRLFEHPADPRTLDRDLERVLLDRALHTFPLALPGPLPEATRRAPFLQLVDEEGLLLACPPTLTALQGGLATINHLLRSQRAASEATKIPAVTDLRARVHGGLLHPGEKPPRAIPDTRSLRLRVVGNAPYVALSTALLLAHRQQPHRLVIHRTGGQWKVRWDGVDRGSFLGSLDAFALQQGWIPLRRPTGGLPDGALFDTLESVGIASTFGRQAVLSERFFSQLRSEPEESELQGLLGPLAQRLEDHLGAL